MEKFDIAVLGGGTAGITAAQIAQANGKRTVLIERDLIGGDCTWQGCVPSKALIQAARLRHEIRRASEFGLRVEGVQVDFPAVMASVHQAIATIAQYEDAAHFEARGIAVRKGSACLTSPNTLAVNGDHIRAERIILCTGSRPSIPPVEGLKSVPYLTNETLFKLNELPHHLIVLGAGVIGLEMGQAFLRLGSLVTVIDTEPTLLTREDDDIASLAQKILEREGMQFILGAEIGHVSGNGKTIAVEVTTEHSRQTIEGTVLLVATGRCPNTEDLGLENVGVTVGKHGVIVNEKLETTIKGVYAAGDVTGLYPFTHVAAYQSRVAANNASGQRDKSDYRVVPWVVFTEPQIAHVGLTEREARQGYGDGIRVVTLPYTAIDRAIIERQSQGMIKVIVGKKPLIGYALGGGEVLGAHLIGPLAGELLHEFVVSMQARTFSGRLAQAIHAYPSMSVGVQQAAALLFPAGRATVDTRRELLS